MNTGGLEHRWSANAYRSTPDRKEEIEKEIDKFIAEDRDLLSERPSYTIP